jgi:outer membrane receptor protein involved in Fe transport
MSFEIRVSHLEFRRPAVGIMFLLAMTHMVVSAARAQSGSEGSIEGVITDPSGAVLPGVMVKACNVNTSAIQSATTDDRGSFRFLVLPVGNYEVQATRGGFAALVQKDVVVTVGRRVYLNLSMSLQTQSETVAVNGETQLVEPTRAHVSSTVEESLIKSLPVNGRNFTDFVALSPGVVRGPSGFSSFGGQRSLNLMLLDGVSNNNPHGGDAFLGFPYQFSVEAVQEFQVNVNGYSAELGRAANGVVSVATKSGTNQFHGSLFWYYRDKALNATDLISKNLGESKEPLHVNQFGGTFGGPILKQKLFFFGSYDAQRRQQRNETFLNLPAGFQLSSNPTVAAFQQQALDYLAPRAIPFLQGFDLDVYFFKADWRIAPSHLLSARLNINRFPVENGFNSGPQSSLERSGPGHSRNDTLAFSLTSTSSPAVVNVARFNYLTNEDRVEPNSVNPQAQVFEGGQLVLNIGRGIQLPQRSFVRQFEWADTLAWSRGRHVLKFGADFILAPLLWYHAPSFSGNYRFNSLEGFGRSLAGTPAPASGEQYIQAFSGEGKPGATLHPDSTEFAAFVQDEWRVRPNLTFNLGLRYDVQWMAQPEVSNPAASLAAAGYDTGHIPVDPNNFSPRFGFAWAPLKGQRLVLRGGYGLYYTWTRGAMAVRTHYQNGIGAQTRTFAAGTPNAAFIPAYPNTICGPPDPSGLPPSCAAPTAGSDVIMPFSPDYVTAYDQHLNFGGEFQLRSDLAISASYLMVKGVHLQRWRDVNLAAPTAASIGIAGTTAVLGFSRFAQPRPIAGFDRILALESAGNSLYHGLAVQLIKRFSYNFQFSASYTLGKVTDDRPEALIFNPGGGADAFLLSDPFNARADRGPAVVDARHRFVASGVWELNYARSLRGVAKAVLGGWDISAILEAQSGLPYSGLVNFDLNSDGNAFSDRTPGQPRNIFRVLSLISLNPRVTRNVRLHENARLQLIAEAFNVFNRANVTEVRTTQYSRSNSPGACGIAGTPCLVPLTSGLTAFGAANATSGPRIAQLSVKLVF